MMEREERGKSLITITDNYTIIDLETTGYDPRFDEIIEFAGIKVKNGKIIDTLSSLTKPNRKIDSFITELTGITNEMVSSAPMIEDIITRIVSFIGDDIVVGHNASFDVNFLYDNYFLIESDFFKNDFLDTLRLSRKLFKELPNHQLSTLASAFNKTHFPSHRAMNDCLATHELLQYIYSYINEKNLDLVELFKRKYTRKVRLDPNSITATTDEIDEDNPIYGLSVCFTGALEKMLRKDALQLVANLGGVPTDSVTKRTNLLVLGDLDYKKNSQGEHKSNKYKKAEQFIMSGNDIKIISETAFLDMIDDDLEKDFYRENKVHQ